MHLDDLISFDPREVEKLDESQMAEFTFVGSIIAANCSLDLLADLLADLTKPYCYSHNEIYYHWPSREWRMIPEATDEDDEFQPSLMWRLIPRFPFNPRDHNLIPGLGRMHEEYDAAFEWLDKLGELEEVETLEGVRTRIDQVLFNLERSGVSL
jgi:hypothetical protein